MRPCSALRVDDVVGAWLADAAQAEGASWRALRALERELEAHGAPEALSSVARRLSKSVRRTAASLESIALRWGVRPRQPSVVPISVRPLEALAAENAGQGCVKETWAALEARYQSLAARDPVIRRVMGHVATEGMRHAEFSWAVDRWAWHRLGAQGREQVLQARADAVAGVLDALRVERERTLCVEAGLPTAATARGLAEALAEALWSRAHAS